jgi:hypothetical protein
MNPPTSTRKSKNPNSADSPMTDERKYTLLFTAALLCARMLTELDSDRPSPAKVAALDTAIDQARLGRRRSARRGRNSYILSYGVPKRALRFAELACGEVLVASNYCMCAGEVTPFRIRQREYG